MQKRLKYGLLLLLLAVPALGQTQHDRIVARQFSNTTTPGITGATPSVVGGNVFVTSNGSPTTVTNLIGDGSVQIITIICADTNTSFANNANISPASGIPYTCALNQTISFVYFPLLTRWVQSSSVAAAGGGGAVSSVFGRAGAVVAAANDYSFSQLSGNIVTSQMNSGTGASGTTFWRGDGTWQVPSAGSGLPPLPTAPNGVTEVVTSTPSGGVGGAAAWSLPGMVTRPVTGATSTDTITSPDCSPKVVEYQGSVAVAVTLPTATTLAVSGCVLSLVNNTSGSATAVTVTPTTWTVSPGGTTLIIAQGQSCRLTVDTVVTTQWDAECHDAPFVAGANITITRGQFGPTISSTAGGTGTVTHTAGALSANSVVLGNGAADVTVAAADSTTTHAFFATAGAPAFRPIAFTDITGVGTCAQEPALTGDVTSSAGSCATTAVALRNIALPTLAASTGYLYDTAGVLSLSTSASNLTTGTLPHAQLPALVSGDIPNNAANTTGTAAAIGTTGSNGTFWGVVAGVQGWNVPAGGGNVSNSGTPTVGQLGVWVTATTIQGLTTLPTAAVPAFTGDMTNSAGSLATTVGKINGTAFPTSATVIGSNGSAQPIAAALANTDIWIGSAGGFPVAQPITGDSTITAAGLMTNVGLRGIALPTLAASTGLLYDTAGTLSLPATLPAAAFPALTGPVTTIAGALATTIIAGGVTDAMLANAYSGVGTPTACSNQFVTGLTLARNAAPTSTCTTATLASAQFANQGTTTTVLHGNAAGNPAFGAVVQGDVTNGYVDLSTAQAAIGGVKTFTNAVNIAGGTTVAPTGTVLIGGGVPWYDVMAPPWNAACDNATDDTAAIQAVLTYANSAPPAEVRIPRGRTCIIATQLSMDTFQNVHIVGGSSLMADMGNSYPRLKFTGNPTTPATLISARSSFGMRISGLTIIYTNASFAGRVIDFQHTGVGCGGGGCDSQYNEILGNVIEGTSSSAGALCGVCLDNSDDTNVYKNGFFYLVNAIQGPTSNQIEVSLNTFGTSVAADVSNAYIKTPGNAWLVKNNDFEMGPSGTVSIVDCTLCTSSNTGSVQFSSNWAGDATGTYSGTYFKGLGLGGAANCAWSFNGGYFGGNITTPNPFLTTAASSTCAFSFHGTMFANFSTLFALGATQTSPWDVAGNTYGGITTLITGTPGSGHVVDNNGTDINYTPGTVSSLSQAFIEKTTGFYHQGTNTIGLGLNSVNQLLWATNLNRNSNNEVYAWSSGDPTAVVGDTAISRVSAGVLGVGINESTGNTAGKLQSSGLIPASAGGADVGTAALPWANLWLGTAATINFQIQGSAGSLNFTAPAPVSVSTTPGTAALNPLNVQAVAGGATTNASGTGGVGSSPSIVAGPGGAASGATASTGGAGGSISLTAGAGGTGAGTGVNANGGSVTVTPGAAGTGGSGTAGKAGVFSVAGSTAGFAGFTQGTTNTTLNTNIPANTIIEQAPTAVTAYTLTKPTAAPTIISYKQTDVCASAVCAETFHPAPIILRVTADFTDASSAALQNITGLGFTFPANQALVAKIDCDILYNQTVGAVADNWGVQDVTVAPTNVYATAVTQIAAPGTTTPIESQLPTLATTTATAIGASFTPSAITTIWHARLHLLVEQPSNASTSAFNIMVQQATAADLMVIKRGSACSVIFQ